MRLAGYIRVSSTDQIEGTSLEAQRQQIEAYAKMKGAELVAVFSDPGVSGSVPIAKRPEGSKLSAMIEARQIDAVVIMRLDRGFRSAVDCLQSVDAWEAHKTTLHILDLGGNSVDSSSPAGRFMLTVLSAAAEMERGMIRERCNGGRSKKKAQGRRIGEVPYGWTVKDPETNELVEVSQEQEAIKLMRRLYKKGHSFREIADKLNSKGIPTKKGKTWTHKQVSSVLKVSNG